ncbi:hypothetical protein N7527_011819 [Penicillium freii]|nr:hypothetical protein N7527_011819 [Penicillium freii]
MTCLYRAGEERHIEFDLAGLPNLAITRAYLQGLARHIRFESTLKYVALPRLTFEAPKEVKRTTRKALPTQKGRTDLQEVFQWLRDNGVQKIIKVIVIDDEHPYHSDTAIEGALGGFGVQIWDWKKVDICSDTISKSSRSVKEISLYSSGNNAVLMGWASPAGFKNTERFPELETVNLYIRWENETDERLQANLNAFKEALEETSPQMEKALTVNPHKDDMAVSFVSDFSNMRGLNEGNSPWIDCLQDFKIFLGNSPTLKLPDGPRVKIAIIDDGVDTSLPILEKMITIGNSFCRHPNSKDLMSAYFAPSGMHGTWMATLISKLCPNPSLYIARLDEHSNPLGDGKRQITAKSAAEAISWAVACNVDIISISWTIESSNPDSQDIKDLVKAIDQAHTKNILVICSASDQGIVSTEQCYPAYTGNCIKIGGADPSGRALMWVREGLVDFLFPGKDIPFENQEGTFTYESGSSIATAAASGLAGLLLSCDLLVNPTTEPSFFHRPENMKTAFKNLGKGTKMPNVTNYFDAEFQRLLAKKEKSNQGEQHVKFETIKKGAVKETEWNETSRAVLAELLDGLKRR